MGRGFMGLTTDLNPNSAGPATPGHQIGKGVSAGLNIKSPPESPSQAAMVHAQTLMHHLEEPEGEGKWQKLSDLVTSVLDRANFTDFERRAVLNVSREGESLAPLHFLSRDDAPLFLAHAIIARGAEINLPATIVNGPMGERSLWTPLHNAAWYMRTNYIDLLSSQSAIDINARDSLGHTALRVLYRAREVSQQVREYCADLLLSRHANPNIPDNEGATVLSICLKKLMFEEAAFLVNHGAHLETISLEETGHIKSALSARAKELVDTEVAYTAFLDTLKAFAPILGKDLLASIMNYPPVEGSEKMLHQAISHGKSEHCLRLIHEMGGTVGAECTMKVQNRVRSKVTALHVAALKSDYAAIKTLLELGADPFARDSEGETPIFYLFRQRRMSVTEPTLDLFLNRKVDIEDTNLVGHSCGTVCFLSSGYNNLRIVLQKGGTLKGLSKKLFDESVAVECSKLEQVVRSEAWPAVGWALDNLKTLSELLQEEIVEKALNTMSTEGLTVFHQLCLHNAPLTILQKAVDFGADLTLLTGVSSADSVKRIMARHMLAALASVDPSGNWGLQPIHLAARCLAAQTVGFLLGPCECDPNAKDAKGNTPLMYLAGVKSQEAAVKSIALSFLQKGAHPGHTNENNETLIACCVKHGDSTFISILQEFYKNVSSLRELEKILGLTLRRGITIDEAWGDIRNLVNLSKDEAEVRSGVALMLTNHGRLDHALLYARAYQEIRKDQITPTSTTLTKLMPVLLSLYTPELIAPFARLIERKNDTYKITHREAVRYHPYAVELMAMLQHKTDPNRSGPIIDILTSSITSISRWIDHTIDTGKVIKRNSGQVVRVQQRPIPNGRVVANWGSEANYSLGFKRLRFDSQRVADPYNGEELAPALLSSFGAERVHFPPAYDRYGSAFVIRPGSLRLNYAMPSSNPDLPLIQEFDSKTGIIFRRGHYIIWNSEWGTQVIRNSSPEFGRFEDPQPAYFSLRGNFTIPELLNLSTEMLLEGGFIPTVSPSTVIEKIQVGKEFLLKELGGFFQAYEGWRFDTRRLSAWEHVEGGGDILIGGHLSPGFEHLYNYYAALFELRDRYPDRQVVIPDLGFIHEDFSVWNQYRYESTDRGTRQRLVVDRNVLTVFERILKGTVTERDYTDSDVRPFFQEAGFSTQGRLILLDPD